MLQCVACGAELELPVRTPRTVYVKSLYRIGGQDYCRHHVIRAAVAAGAAGVIARDKVLTTVALAIMARVEHANLLAGRAVHVPYSEVGCAVGTSWTSINPWSVFTADQESHLLELP